MLKVFPLSLFRTCLDLLEPAKLTAFPRKPKLPLGQIFRVLALAFQMKRPFYPRPSSPLVNHSTRPPCQTFKLKSPSSVDH